MKLLAAIILFFGLPVWADPIEELGPSTSAKVSNFETVTHWYSEGTLFRTSEIFDLSYGRCFSPQSNQGVGTMVAATVQFPGSAGPGFPKEDKFVVAVREPATYFDPVFPNSKQAIVEEIAGLAGRFSEVVEKDGALVSLYDFEKNGRPDVEMSFRKKGDYVVALFKNLVKQKYPIRAWDTKAYSGKEVAAEQVIYACYYFGEAKFKE